MFETSITYGVPMDHPSLKPQAAVWEEVKATALISSQETALRTVILSPLAGPSFEEVNFEYAFPSAPEPPPKVYNHEAEWQNSPYKDLPFQQGIDELRAEELLQYRRERDEYEEIMSRSPGGFLRGAARVGTFIGVQAFDPINYIPFVGYSAKAINLGRAARGLPRIAGLENLTVAAAGSRGKAALIGGTDAAIGNTLVDAAIIPYLREVGEERDFRDAALDALLGFGIGGIFGALVNHFAQKAARGAAGNQPRPGDGLSPGDDATVRAGEVHNRNMERSIAQLIKGDPVKVEAEEIGRLYNYARANPVTGDPYTPQVRLEYAQLADELENSLGVILVDKGEGKWVNGNLEVNTDTAFGMVKFQLKHDVSKEDMIAFPSIIREYKPRFNAKNNSYNWVILKEDNRAIVYAIKQFTKTDGQYHLVTVHYFAERQKKPSFSQKISLSESSTGGFVPHAEIPPDSLSGRADIPPDGLPRTTGGQESDSLNITLSDAAVNRTEINFDVPANPAPDMPSLAGERAGIAPPDPAINHERARIEQSMRDIEDMAVRGELSEDELLDLQEVKRLAEEEQNRVQGLIDMLNCLTGK